MNLNTIRIPFLLVMCALFLNACMNSSNNVFDPYEQLKKETAAIDNFLESNNLTAVKDVTGVRMVISQLGTGLPANVHNTVNVDYTGKLFTTGAVFDEGNVTGPLSGYINGWKIALSTLPRGSKATLYIPSGYGYGNNGQGSIPANSTLVFDIDFKDVVFTSAETLKFKSDTTAIKNYLVQKNITALHDPSGLSYVITQPGTGNIPFLYDKVKIKYSFKLLNDDTKVVSSLEREPTAEFYSRVIDYIHGVKIGLLKLRTGSMATLYIPSGLGFGAQEIKDGAGAIVFPANSNLIIEMELISIVP